MEGAHFATRNFSWRTAPDARGYLEIRSANDENTSPSLWPKYDEAREMSRWYRRYAGTVSDPKIAEAALIAECSRAVVIATWDSILESAAELNDGGRYKVTPRNVTATLQEKMETIDKVFSALRELEMIDDAVVLKWKDRQFQSDSSNDRVKKYRERRKAAGLPQQPWFNAALKAEVLRKNEGCCVYCNSSENITIDHMTPPHRGGTEQLDNLQPACRSCNADKRNMTHDEYLAWPGRVTLQKRPHTTESDTYTETELVKSVRPEYDAAPAKANGPDEIAGLNGSTGEIVGGVAKFLNQLAPDYVTARRIVASNVGLYGDRAVRDGYAELIADVEDNKVRVPSAKVLQGYFKTASERPKQPRSPKPSNDYAAQRIERGREFLSLVNGESA